MFNSKNIIIVAPTQYSDLSRMISHEISKIKDCTSTFWTIKKYIDNESNITNNQYAIFIGNHEENVLSKDYLPAMKTELPANEAGIFYAFDDTKAIVFGDGKLEQIKEFKKLYERVKNGEIIVDEDSSNANDVGSYFVATVLLGLIGIGFMFLFKFYSKKKKENKLRKEQTKLALTLFLSGNFNSWLNIKEEAIVENV
jgi:hypothetical protein